MASETSWSKYLRPSTPPTISSLAFTSLWIFYISIASSSCVRCTACALLSAHILFFLCGDDTPPFGTVSCFVSCSVFGSRPCCVELVVDSSCYRPFPLDASNFILSTSSFGYSGCCAGSCSSSICIVVCLYFGVWISSTSTTLGISFVPVCGTRVLLRVFRLVLIDAPTLGGGMVRKSGL
jgi:hypothetical protein